MKAIFQVKCTYFVENAVPTEVFVDIFPLSETEGPSFLWQFVLSDVIYSNQGCLRTYYLKIYFIFLTNFPLTQVLPANMKLVAREKYLS